MRADRLYAITVYLLNHGRTSAAELAEHFEVSVRTIQRDMDSLCSAGIPVTAVTGVHGGYEIMEHFTLDKHLISPEDYSYILTALKGLFTATKQPQIAGICEKVSSLNGENHNGMLLDFSVLREGNWKYLEMLQSAINNQKAVQFRYTNSRSETRMHTVEPIAVVYRWYSWYLLAYSTVKSDYRIYKILRMEDLELTGQNFTREHETPEVILADHDRNSKVTYTTVTAKCNPDFVAKTCEYLNGKVIRYLSDQMAIMEFRVVESEQLWIGTLLSFGDNIEILAPEHIRNRFIHCAEKIISLYQNYDTMLS